ncbi:hypothetical protein RJ639_001125 [Escallonia herrerae]|uniref:RRM domain-containing protein n=1 Tax=Escallonia herrerae TaxID=1293975 RepID=A0AA88XAB2_9ASTE|nr:hypothetical protein RJ639_001125 [Escallonia herrerae]
MAVVESSNRTESQAVVQNDVDQSKPNHQLRSNDQNFHLMVNQQQQQKVASPLPPPAVKAVQANGGVNHHEVHMGPTQHSVNGNGAHPHQMARNGGGDGGEGFKREMRDLEEMLSKLNPMAEEFVPPSLGMAYLRPVTHSGGLFGYTANNFVMHTNSGIANGNIPRRKKLNNGHGKRRMNSRTGMAQREDVIKRTVTEEQLAALFINCGQVVDCRVCGDPNSVLRFAFIEFTDEEGARNALSLAGTMLGYYPVRVLPSKTAIAPVNPTFLPRSEDEREMCARTIYCTNIDKKVTQGDVKLFFESICGEVHRLKLLGDYHHSTRIAFVEFVMAESAIAALNCSGAVLGSLPIRVSPSKTPVRPRSPRPSMH